MNSTLGCGAQGKRNIFHLCKTNKRGRKYCIDWNFKHPAWKIWSLVETVAGISQMISSNFEIFCVPTHFQVICAKYFFYLVKLEMQLPRYLFVCLAIYKTICVLSLVLCFHSFSLICCWVVNKIMGSVMDKTVCFDSLCFLVYTKWKMLS